MIAIFNSSNAHSWQFAINYPSMVSAIVVAGQASRFSEATSYAKFKGISNTAAAAWYINTCQY
jgi:hypothetical protein